MFDVGFQEIVLISVIALLVIGPERLPSVARSVGLWVGKVQRFVAGVKRDLQSELNTDEVRKLLNTQEDQIRELKAMVNETRTDFERTAKAATSELSAGMDQAVDQVKDAAETVKENRIDDTASQADAQPATEQPAPAPAPEDKPKTGSA